MANSQTIINTDFHEWFKTMELAPCLRAGSQFDDFCFSHDSKYIFFCSGSFIKVYNTSNGECVHDLKAHTKKVTGIAVNTANTLQVISCGQDRLLIYWDYLDGVKLKVYNLHVPLYGIVSVNADKKSLMMIVKTSEHKTTFSLLQWKRSKPTYNEFGKPKMLIQDCSADKRLISFGCSREFIASGLTRKVKVYSMTKESVKTLKDSEKYNKDKRVTCVSCHPTEYMVACGLENGRIILWHNIFHGNPVPSTLHWHALPVLCLDFSTDGSILLSGGHECVLVRWQMSGAQFKDFKPRLGAPVTHVLSSPDGNFYATKHSNNVVQLMNINLTILQVYRGLTRGNIGLETGKNPIPSGLQYDSRSQALVTNGLPGHLQFYSLSLHKQLFNLDIVGQNYISPENLDRPKAITEVTRTAISDNGVWLATFELWDDGCFTPEQRLKFWTWSSQAQTYCLNTTVEFPHDGHVTMMTFCPHPKAQPESSTPTLVTVGTDKCFKLWTLIDDTDIYRSNTRWNCESVGFYRCLDALTADFSRDGSALAVGFEHLLTLWDPNNNVVKTTLSNSLPQKENIGVVKFGSHKCQHHLVVITEKHLLVWDLLTLTISWSISRDVAVLFRDPASDLMGCITTTQQLFVFKPSSSKTIYNYDNVSSCPVQDALFVPNGRPRDVANKGWPGMSQIYLFNTDEELITFDITQRDLCETKKVKVAQNLPDTTVHNLIAEKMVRETGEQRDSPGLGSSYIKTDKDSFLSMVLHSNEPVSLHCTQYLQSLLVKRKQRTRLGHSADKVSSEGESSSESEMESDQVPSSGPGHTVSGIGDGRTIKTGTEDEVMDKILTQSTDWVQWCAALNLQ